VKCAEEEARAAGEVSRNHQELAITLRGERDAAMAERDRVEKERGEAVAEVERLKEAKGGEEGVDAHGVESTCTISKVTQVSIPKSYNPKPEFSTPGWRWKTRLVSARCKSQTI
jgi:hypothetical protein